MAATLESVKKAIGKKTSSLAFAWLADLERIAGKPDVALNTVNTGLTYLPDYLPGLLVRSAIYFDLERWDDVIESCEVIVKKDPFCIAAWRRLGKAYHKTNNIAKRNFSYRIVHDMDPLDSFWKEEYALVPQEKVELEDSSEINDSSLVAAPFTDLDDEFNSEEQTEQVENLPPNLVNEDPFSMLSDLLPSDEESGEDHSIDSLESSLESVMSDLADSDEVVPEYFGGDDISDNDVSSAFSSIFGMDDDLPAEKAVSPFASFDIPTSIEDEEPEVAVEDSISDAFISPPLVEEKPQSVSSAFDDIFGEDELPEELTEDSLSDKSMELETPSFNEEESLETEFEKSVELETPSFNEEASIDDDFEKAETNLASELEAVVPPLVPPPLSQTSPAKEAEEFASAVDSSFSAIFGDDDDLDLPQEKPVAEFGVDHASIEKSVENSFSALFGEDDAIELPKEQDTSAETDGAVLHTLEEDVDHSFAELFGEDDALDISENTPKTIKDDTTLRHIDVEDEVSGAFASLFSSEDDDFPEEEPQARDGVGFLMSGDSDDEMSVALMNDPSAALDQDESLLDENLNTKTLAEIYFEQGLYTKALKIYKDLAKKSSADTEIQKRVTEIEQIVDEKYGDDL